MTEPLRCAVVMPAPAPYREPLFASLAQRPDLALRVLYQDQRVAGWNVDDGWYASSSTYEARFLSALQRARAGRSAVMVPRGLRGALDEFAPEVVVVSEFGPTALLARAWCSRHRRPLIHFSELGAAAARAVPRAQRRVHALLARRAAGAIGASTQARDRLIALGAPPARTVVSLQSVDAKPIRAAAAQRPREPPRRPMVLLCVARLVADKNLGALIEAAAGAGADAVALHLIGDGPLRRELQAQANASDATVRFHGSLSPSATARAYAEADVLALVSRHEPFGVALREGVAAGLPLIASAYAGATGDVAVAGRNAIVVDPDDGGAIAAAVRALAVDPPLRAAMAAASRELDREWPLQRSVDAFARAVLLAAETRRTATRS